MSNPLTTGLSIPSEQDDASNLSLSTLGIHADDPMNHYTDVAPALHVATTFRYSSDPDKLVPVSDDDIPNRIPGGAITADAHIYSRLTAPNSSRLELILTSLIGQPCLTCSSGLSAFHALLVHLQPRVVAIGNGYHGCHGVLKIYQRLTNCRVVDLFDEKTWEGEGWKLGEGDIVHLETPVNPTGIAYNIEEFARKAHARGARLIIDATFAPPPLMDPFKWGADFVMHSGTKYFGGHSDMLCGVVAISKQTKDWQKSYWSMFADRLYIGSVPGSLEGWLGVRSLRTLELRVMRQSESADKLVHFLNDCVTGTETGSGPEAVKKVLARVDHASLQTSDMSWLKQQMPNGFGPVFCVSTYNVTQARRLPSKLSLFHHATSLGGVESLIEWRRMSDSTVEDTVLRVSVGVEGWEDLKADLVMACKSLVEEDEAPQEPEIEYDYRVGGGK